MKGKQHADEGDLSPKDVLPEWYRQWPEEKKQLAMRVIDGGGGWSDPGCLVALCSACDLEVADLQNYMACYFVEKYGNEGPPRVTEEVLRDALPASLQADQKPMRNAREMDAFVYHPRRMKVVEGDTPDMKRTKNMEWFSHLCRRRAHASPPPKITYEREVEARLTLEISPVQCSIIAPTEDDLACGRLLRDVSGGGGSLRVAARKLNCIGEISSQCSWLNAPGRLDKIDSNLALALSMDKMKEMKNTNKISEAEKKVKVFRMRSPAALRLLAGCEFNVENVKKKLTMGDLKGIMLTELSVGATEVPTGNKDKIVAKFMELVARRDWTPPGINALPVRPDSPHEQTRDRSSKGEQSPPLRSSLGRSKNT
jgi:hypothetical protein